MRVLVIEDEKKIADSLKKGLVQESFAVDIAYNGNKGYDLAATENYDAIILDLMLPGMDGMEICQRLRKESVHAPILMLTARSTTEDKVEGLNMGADDYLAKPFSFDELLARLRALTRRPKKTLKTTLKIANITLDPQNLEVTKAGKPIKMSKKEFALLEFLLRNKNKVVTKEQIIQNVWDFDADVLPNTVEVYIGYLRAKLDDSKNNTLIKTVRGFGYKLSENV